MSLRGCINAENGTSMLQQVATGWGATRKLDHRVLFLAESCAYNNSLPSIENKEHRVFKHSLLIYEVRLRLRQSFVYLEFRKHNHFFFFNTLSLWVYKSSYTSQTYAKVVSYVVPTLAVPFNDNFMHSYAQMTIRG